MSEIIQGVVVEMTWATLVARGDLPKLARQRARREKGNWFSHLGHEATVGIAQIKGRVKLAKGDFLSAGGRLVGPTSPSGTAFFAINIPDAGQPGPIRVWVCGVANGVPVNLFDRVVSEVEAPQVLEAFLQRREVDVEDCAIHGDAGGMPSSMAPMSWDDLARLCSSTEAAKLKPVRQSAFDGMSNQGKLGVVAAGLAIAAYLAYGEYDKANRRKMALSGAAQAVHVNPHEEWAKAVVQWASTKVEPGPAPLLLLRRGLATVPVEVAGWALSEINCTLAAQGGWTCSAAFEPLNDSIDTLTGEFLRQRPAEWVVVPKGLKRIDVVFSFVESLPRMSAQGLKTVAWHMQNTTSMLQSSMRGFTAIAFDDFVPAQIAAPVGPDGGVIGMPSGVIGMPSDFKLPAVAQVRLAGPLRSMDLQSIQDLPAVWTRAVVKIVRQSSALDAKTSSITIEARGEIYAIR